MATISEAFTIAIQHVQAGRLQAAEQVCFGILRAEPQDADALHLLGIVYARIGDRQGAVEYLHRAVTARPDWAEAHANLGNALREQGRFDEAVPFLRRALQLRPDYAAAQNNLGNALEGQGDAEGAVACYRRALELAPDFAEAHNNLGNALKTRGDREGAIACYRRAVELAPGFAAAHYNLGIALSDVGRTDEAVACYRRAVELAPDFAAAHNNLGNALKGRGRAEEAIACYLRAIELWPNYAAAHNNLGIALSDLGRTEEAVACYRRAVALRPDFAEAHDNLGMALGDLGQLDEVIACHRRAIELAPDFAEAHNNLGNALERQGELEDAIACYRRALEPRPDYAEALGNLGNALRGRGELEAAIVCHRRALELRPDSADAYGNLGNAFRDSGCLDEALACYRRALELKPDHAPVHSNWLDTLHYAPGVTPAALLQAHAGYDRRHAAPLSGAVGRPEPAGDLRGRIRLGFVSPDLGRHPVGSFLVRVLENLDPEQCETICYSDRIVQDGLTHRLRAAATGWRDTIGLNHQRLAEQIRADRIDVLFDLAGHTARNRLLAFARKPAPIQVTWIGYEGTTGLHAMDYLLADHRMVPPGTEQHYRERVLRMPDGYLCYDPPEAAPPVGPPPCLTEGFATFGSFHNPAKITPDVVAVWARILRAAPGTRLVMKYRGLGDRSVHERFLDLFAAHGVAPQRLELLPWSSYLDYLATYHRVDVALDPFPFSGSAITCESLWMGVPAVTCPGETFASRHSLGHVSSVGLTETIARDLDDYVERAVALAGDPARLAALRSGLRERMAASPLCDGERFASHLTALLRDVCEKSMG
jgi:predicted O-linked N-acetylglucosamine transferase (SPINDLY family)